MNPIYKSRLLIFYLTCRDREAQSHCSYLIFLSQVSFSWFLDQYFGTPRLSLTGRHIFFVCAVD